MKIKVISTSLNLTKQHEEDVNRFLQSNIGLFDIIKVENNVVSTPNARRTDGELVTIITYS